MQKKWIKISDFNYSLLIGEKETGKIEIPINTDANKAAFNIDGKVFEINRTGLWKATIEITGSNGEVVLKAYPEKWYANTAVIEFEGEKYTLVIRNNPLAEYAIIQNGKDVLTYGLSTESGELRLRIAASGNHNIIFDFLLWYLFVPVANENFGNTYSFLLQGL